MKVGIFGYGYVGQATILTLNDVDISIYDKYKNHKSISDVVKSDFIFVCVSTPSNEDGFDSSAIDEMLAFLIKSEYKGIVIVKSTVPYSYLSKYEERLNLVFSPEFLNQNTFAMDALEQDIVILGGDARHCKSVMELYENHSINPMHFEVCTLKEACDFKYTRNLYGAYKVLFWEFIQDTTGNSRKMANLYKLFPQPNMSQVGMDGFRGFGGACFPKDVKAWDSEFAHKLTKFMLEYNLDLNQN